MNICYCLDTKYLKYTVKSLKSYMKYHRDINFYFLVSKNIPVLKGFGTVIQYDKELLSEFTQDLCGYTHVSLTAFARFLIPLYLKNKDRVLYVDGDTLCRGNISSFYNTDFENNYIIGSEGINFSRIQAKELGLDFYINSGVLLLNIPKMLEEGYYQQILDKWKGCLHLPKVFSADETIINYVFHNKIKLASEYYNYCYKKDYSGRNLSIKNAKILHFTGQNKYNFVLL